MSQTPLPANVPAFVKAHATGVDFLLHLDRDGTSELPTAQIARMTDRSTGPGATGLIRAVPTALIDPQSAARAEWFMDSRGPDGAPLDVDGDDLRVFVAFLRHAGVLDLPDRAETAVATRSGVFTVRREGQEYAVDMGPWTFPGGEDALADGFDLSVIADGLTEQRPGLRVGLRGEHVVVALQDEETLAGLSMTGPAQVDPPLEGPAMLEFVLPLGEQEGGEPDAAGVPVRTGVIRMRARSGPSERRSSGTGACAAAVAVREWFGDGAAQTWQVHTPGGRLRVRMTEGHAELAGPAQLIGTFTVLP